MDMDLFVQLKARDLCSYTEYLKMCPEEALAMLEAHNKVVAEIQAKQKKEAERQQRMAAMDDLMSRSINALNAGR